jgi:hypothetical protein
VVAAYDMYIECCKGGLNPEWFIEEKDRKSFRAFRLKLSGQMLTYDPKDQLYPGDENFRSVTKVEKQKREGGRMYWKSDERGGVSVENFKISKSSSRYSPSRLCVSLDDIEKHVATINRSKCTAECAVCGSPTY